MIDPIEKLREWIPRVLTEDDHLYDIADEIEAAYMKLPVDADGVPIRPGDLLVDITSDYELHATRMFLGASGWAINARRPDELRHVKPDTVESLLQELADEVWNASCESETTWSDSGLDGIAERYAERIREAVEHD